MIFKQTKTLILCILLISPGFGHSAENQPNAIEEEIQKLENPFTVQYIKKNLRKSQPRLVLNSSIEKQLKKKLKSDAVIQNMFEAVKLNANSVLKNRCWSG
jgi:hypothetical protein